MRQTYEFYVQDASDSPPRFRPLTCATVVEAMQTARELLAQDGEIASVEVRLAGEHLFTLDR